MKIISTLLLGLILVATSIQARKQWLNDLSDILDDATRSDDASDEIVTSFFENLVADLDNIPLPIKNITCIKRHCTE